MGFISQIRDEWNVLKAAPFSFLITLAVGIAIGIAIMTHQVADANSRVQLRDDQINSMNGELDDFRGRFQKELEDIKRQLSKAQISELKKGLSDKVWSAELIVGEEGTYPPVMAKQIADVLTESGWAVSFGTDIANIPATLAIRTKDDLAAVALRDAFKAAGIPYEAFSSAAGITDLLISRSAQAH